VVASALVSFAAPSRQDDSQNSEKVYQPEEVDQRARVTKRSELRYNEKARRNRTSGWVVLRVVLKSSGEIGDIKVIRGLEDGLTEVHSGNARNEV
jgi:outer membrane biosynthesis protein TonB